MKIGGHVSAAGGLYKSVARAESIGANCFQIFGASPRGWSAPLPKDEDIRKYLTALKTAKLGPVYLHAAYLVNLASPSSATVQKSIKSLIDHLNIANAIKADGLIFHIGSGKGMDKIKAINQIALGAKKVLATTKGPAKLILENDAGGGGKVGSRLEDIGLLLKKIKSNRIGVCFDTAHAFESGLIMDYTPKASEDLWSEFSKAIGLENLLVIHVNDSKTLAGSNHDKHANLGEGYIKLTGFKNLLRDRRIKHTTLILEVPGFNDEGPDKRNIDILKKIIS